MKNSNYLIYANNQLIGEMNTEEGKPPIIHYEDLCKLKKEYEEKQALFQAQMTESKAKQLLENLAAMPVKNQFVYGMKFFIAPLFKNIIQKIQIREVNNHDNKKSI